jgi:ferredoxin-NADP reductase
MALPKLQFINKNMVADSTFSFNFKNIGLSDWQAGQFVQLVIPHKNPDNRGEKRFFTISSTPFEKNITITTRIEEAGASTYKKAFSELKAGQILECSEPTGGFLAEEFDKKLVFVAGGIGITPIRAILLNMTYNKILFHADLLYAGRNTSFAFKDELEHIKTEGHDLKIYYFIEPRIINEKELNKIYKTFDDKIFYLSGPINMVKAIEEVLSKKNVLKKNIKTDFFPGYD